MLGAQVFAVVLHLVVGALLNCNLLCAHWPPWGGGHPSARFAAKWCRHFSQPGANISEHDVGLGVYGFGMFHWESTRVGSPQHRSGHADAAYAQTLRRRRLSTAAICWLAVRLLRLQEWHDRLMTKFSSTSMFALTHPSFSNHSHKPPEQLSASRSPEILPTWSLFALEGPIRTVDDLIFSDTSTWLLILVWLKPAFWQLLCHSQSLVGCTLGFAPGRRNLSHVGTFSDTQWAWRS